MTSSLAQQLKRLSVPSNALSCHGPSKHRASLLFDSKEAAMLDREQVFNIGINGLTELENINRNFGKFEKILFSQSSMALDRTVQTKEVNSQINEIIKEFLAAASPFFLMKAVQKCLEWLIYRFYIHKMNIDDFVLCILPHHDSDMFPRALKLMKLDDPTSTWHFLHECSKMNVPLPRRVLINRCKRDPGFLSFMSNHLVSQIAKFDLDEDTSAPRLSLNFYTILLLGVINKRTEINENLVKIVVLNVEKGLKSTNREVKAANYMILAQLTSIVVPLKLEVTLRLISVLLKYVEPSVSKEAILCLNVVLKNQKIEKLSDALLTSIAGLLEDLPFDEVCASVRHSLTQLLYPSTEMEVVRDETDNSSDVLNNLNHRKSSKRIVAVNQLAQMATEENSALSVEFICDCFLNRLQDEDHKVVLAVLELDEVLVMKCDKMKLLMTLVDLIETKYISHKWQHVVQLAVKTICSSGIFQNTSGLTLVLLGWLLITETNSLDRDLISAQMILSSDISKENHFIKALPASDLAIILKEAAAEGNTNDAVVDHLSEYNVKLISSLAKYLLGLSKDQLKKTLDDLTTLKCAKSFRAHFLIISSLSVALSIPLNEPTESKELVLCIASSLLNLYENQCSSETKEDSARVQLDKSIDYNMVPWLSNLRETHGVPVSLVQWSILQMITALKSYSLADDGLDADRSEPLVSVLVRILNIVADKTWPELQTRFQMDIDQTSQLKILMMLMSEIFDLKGRDPSWVPSGIYLALFEMLPYLCNEAWTLDYLINLPGLILCLQSSHQDVRIGAVCCLQKFRKHCRLSEETNHGKQLKRLLKRRKFVMVDQDFTSEVGYVFFRCLPSVFAQQKFVTHLVDFVVGSSEQFMANTVKNCLKDLKVEGEHVSHELTLPEGGSMAIRKEGGKKRTKVAKNLDAVIYRRIVFVLEVLERRKKLRNAAETMGLLFQFLSRLISVNDEKADHCRQLTLACLCSICKHWKSKDLDIMKDHLNKKHLDVESLRYCISDSFNTQVQQQALTLLAFIAPLYPEYVLTNAVAIFTFMGTNLVQLDNSYTFLVIMNTIDAVMSAVVNVQPSVEGDQGTNRVLIDLINIFVDARDHIPGHRKLPLFHHLIERVGVEAYLWSLIVLIMDSCGRKVDPKQTVEEKTVSVNKDIELISNICTRFSVDIQLMTVTKIIIFIQSLLTALSKGTSEDLPILTDTPVKSFLGLMVHLSRTILEILGRRELIVEVLKRSEGRKIDEVLENSLRDLILQSLKCLSEATRLQGGAQTKNIPPKFWPVLIGKLPKILHKATYLLPMASFLEVVQSLLDHELPSIQLRSFEILIGKVCPPAEGPGKVPPMSMSNLSSEEMISLKKLITRLASLVNTDQVKCNQMALYSIQVLCARLGKDKPELFVSVIPVVIKTVTARGLPSLVFDVSLTCVSELCRTLGNRCLLKYLQMLMSPTIELLEDDNFLMHCNETTIICLLVAIKEIIKCFGEMLDTYITRLLCFTCAFPETFARNKTCSDRHKIEELLNMIVNEMATRLESRVLLPKAVEAFKSLLESNQVGLAKFFSFIRLHVSNRSTELRQKSDDLLVDLVELFDEGMNLRSQATQLTWEQMLSVETEMIESIYAMVLPLTDNQFSTIFQKFFSYVATEKSPESKLRLLTFFHLSDSLCAKLQDLFIKYALHVLTAATEFLVENCGIKQFSWFTGEDADKKTCLMLDYVIGCLHKCLLFDKDGSFAVKCVKKVMLPIVEQLENFVGGENEYKNRITQHVVPCIGQLAIAAKKVGTWKDLNYQVCLKSRNTNSDVRIASLLTIEEMARRLGQEYDALLPETMPFLAELLEDDDNDVTEECRRIKGVIEEIIGALLNDCFE